MKLGARAQLANGASLLGAPSETSSNATNVDQRTFMAARSLVRLVNGTGH